MVFEYHFSCFEILEHIGKTCFDYCCFELGFMQCVNIAYLCGCFHVCGFVNFNNVVCQFNDA